MLVLMGTDLVNMDLLCEDTVAFAPRALKLNVHRKVCLVDQLADDRINTKAGGGGTQVCFW